MVLVLVCGSDGSIGAGVISPSWWRDWGRHSLNTAQSSPAPYPANTRTQGDTGRHRETLRTVTAIYWGAVM